jgi:hypothetical protein
LRPCFTPHWAPAKRWPSKDPGGDGVAYALALNNKGQSVGYYDGGPGATVAALWSATGAVTDLDNILGSAWSNTEATGINNAGDIIGQGDDDNGAGFFLLMHVPSAMSDPYEVVTYRDTAPTLAAVSAHP